MSHTDYIHGTAAQEQNRLNLLNRLTNKSFVDFLNLNPDDRVLEVGSGLGILAQQVAQQLSTGTVCGLEYCSNQLAQSPKNTPNLSFIQGDAHQLPFENESFDVVYGRYIIEHVRHPIKVLAEMHRVLKNNARLYLQENNTPVMDYYPDCPRFKSVWQQFVRLQAMMGGDSLVGKKIYSMAKQAGFQSIELSIAPEIHYPESGTLKTWVDNIIGNIESASQQLIDRQMLTQEALQSAITEMQNFKKLPNGSIYFYWNRLAARK